MEKKRTLILTLITAFLLAEAAGAADPGPRAWLPARAAIETYFKAYALGNGDYIRQAFSSDAEIALVEEGHLRHWTRDELAARFHGPADDEYRRVRQVESLDVHGTAASAVVTLEYPKVVFRDHLSLFKSGDEWKIVSKVFSADYRDAGKEAVEETLNVRMLSFEPRRILGNIYYVGSNLISSFLIVTPAGHILIDTGPIQMLPRVEANIEKLGFRTKDVKLLLNSHAHFDHCGGFAEFKRQTGVSVVASKLDGELMMRSGKGDFYWGNELSYEPITPDRFIGDGERVDLGGVSLTAHLTPGHTEGCLSWSMKANENGKLYDVLFLCGLTVSHYKLTNNERYPNIVQDAQNSITELHSMHVDVLLASHGFWFDLEGKAARQKEGAPNPFIDPEELGHHLAQMQNDLNQALQAQERQR